MKRDAPILAEYLGGAVNCDAYHMTDPRADGLGVSTCIESSLEDAGVAAEEVFFFGVLQANLLVARTTKFLGDCIFFIGYPFADNSYIMEYLYFTEVLEVS